jgi:hypothetical protein
VLSGPYAQQHGAVAGHLGADQPSEGAASAVAGAAPMASTTIKTGRSALTEHLGVDRLQAPINRKPASGPRVAVAPLMRFR